MNLYTIKVPKQEVINNSFLTNLYLTKSNKGGFSFNDSLAKNSISSKKNIPEELERKFQFKFILKAFNSLIKNRKRTYNPEYQDKLDSQKFSLPKINRIDLAKNKTNKWERYIRHDYQPFRDNRNFLSKPSLSMQLKDISLNNNPEINNNEELNEIISNSNNVLEKSNSTVYHSKFSNKSTYNNVDEKSKIPLEKIKHDAKYEYYKKKHIHFLQNVLHSKNKQAKIDFDKKLEQIRKEKIPKTKYEEYFKEYQINFSPEKFIKKLNIEFSFFQDNSFKLKNKSKSKISEKKIRKNNFNERKYRDLKYGFNNYETNYKWMKPSERIIQTILRKQKNYDLYAKSLINLDEKEIK